MRKALAAAFFFALATQGFAEVNNPAPEVTREEVDQAMDDLNKVLTEARAVPHFENGQPAGYKKVQIQPGGTYEKLSLKSGEVITAPNPNYVPPAEAAEDAQPDNEQ